MTAPPSHPRRSDARDNRERILDAARAVFATDGLGVPVREIARRAGVGPATVYRHFPTKEVLVTAAFAERMRACKSIVDRGLADPDPWHGFRVAVEDLCDLYARDRGLTAAFMTAFPRAMDFAAIRTSALTSAAELTRRAKATGRLRPDVVLDDLVLVITANSGIHAGAPAARVVASRRFAALVIRGFEASPASSPVAEDVD